MSANPVSQSQPRQFIEIARPLIERGIPVIPVEPYEKRCLLPEWPKLATTDLRQIKAWNAENPHFNVGAVGKPDGFVMLDCDVVGLREQIEKSTGQEFPRTFTVRSAGKGCEHIYFLQTDMSRSLGNRKSADLFDLQSVDKYVVGAGSILENGKSYDIIDDSPIAEFPTWLGEWVSNHSQADNGFEGGAPVHEDFDFDAFCDHYDIEVLGDNDGKYILKRCPVKGDHHTTEGGKPDYRATCIFHDGATIGFKCLATSCEGSNMTIGGLIRWLNKHGYEHYPNPIFEQEEQIDIETLLNDFDVEQVTDEPAAAVEELCYRKPPCACGMQHAHTEEAYAAAVAKAQEPEEMALVTVRASAVKMEVLQWLWKDRIPLGKITWFAGMPDCGKSITVVDLVARVSTGSKFPDDSENKWGAREVLLGVSEDGIEDTVVPRLAAAGADLDNVHIIKFVTPEKGDSKKKRMLMLSEDIVRIYRYLKANPQIVLVALDPITSYFGNVDSNKDKEIRPVMDELSKLCDMAKVTFVAVMHLNKRSDVSAIHKILGASSVAGSARTAWGFSPDPEDKELKHMSLIKNNLSKDRSGLDYRLVTKDVLVNGVTVGHAAIEWVGVNEMSADEQMQHAREVQREGKADRDIDRGKDFLRKKFSEKPEWKCGGDTGLYEEAKASGLLDRTLKRARVELLREGLVTVVDDRRHVHDGYYWMLKLDSKPEDKIPDVFANEAL